MQRFPTGLLLTGLAWLSVSGAPLPASSPASSSGIQYRANAFGSSAQAANAVFAGKSALVTFGNCGTLRAPRSKSNTLASVNAQPALSTGVVNTTAAATEVSRTQTARATAVVSSVNLLAGLVTAREVRVVSSTSHDDFGFRTSPAGSSLVGLAIAGLPITVTPGPNTRFDLPGIGYVVLNEQISSVGATSASLTVNMLHVFASLPNPLVPVGTNVIVGHATSELRTTSAAGIVGGFAYGSRANAGSTVLAGKSAPVSLGCFGTNGALVTESVASVVLPEFTTGVVVDTASGIVSAASASAETTSTVEALDLLSSLVTADVVKANAHSFTDGSVFTFSDAGSSFVNLSVAGFPALGDDVAPNTRVSLAGIGTLWLKRELFGPNSIEIRMIELVVEQENGFGVPVGARLQVGVAHASAR